ncbi:Superoxide dismutase (Mn) [[Mycoplasma] cavipharyngis]|uniref:superoxide dismutase n=1 Tax=[Mycoplasma] cavipharyngis TaxID=92757 RepID=UPI0037040F95
MFKLPKLNYDYNALEPEIDAKTMEIHYTKHHQGYLDNLNDCLSKFYPEGFEVPIAKLMIEFNHLPENIKTVVRNHGGGFTNHNFFWEILSPEKNQAIPEELEQVLIKSFGSFDQFKAKFEQVAKSRFGSGWAWLVFNTNNTLEIISTPNQDSPLMNHQIPILGLDVWEHAYYLKYHNRRAEYLTNFWKIINWKNVHRNLIHAQSSYSDNPEKVCCSGCS